MSRFVATVVMVSLLSSGVASAATANRQLPQPTGKSAVGRVAYHWKDDARGEPNTSDEQDRRELRVDVWYPAEPTADAKPAEYLPDLAILSKKMGPEAMLVSPIKGHALAAPPIAAGVDCFPVLVFSPGLGTNGAQYAFLVEELVSHGYVVATIDHPFQSRAIAYPNGRIVTAVESPPEPDPQKYAENYRKTIELRAGDLRFVLNQLQRLNAGEMDQRLVGRLDLKHAGAFGHSIGGITASEACAEDDRFQAAVNLDGHTRSLPFLPNREGNGPRQPVLELTDGYQPATDKDLARWKVTREEFDRQHAEMIQRVDTAMRTVAAGSYRVTIPGVSHGSFADMAIWDTVPLEVRYRRMQVIRDYTRAMFDKTLRGQTDTLVDAAQSPYQEVTLERFRPTGK